MLKKGMTVYNKTHEKRLLAILIAPKVTPKGTPGWNILILGSEHMGFWFEENIVPLIGTNDDAASLLLHKNSLF